LKKNVLALYFFAGMHVIALMESKAYDLSSWTALDQVPVFDIARLFPIAWRNID